MPSKYVMPVQQWLLGATVFLLFPFCSKAQVSLPPVNLGLTNFEDGVAFPGFLIEETGGNYRAGQFKDGRGQTIPGSNEANAITSLTHIAWVSKWRILGGYFGAEVVLPAADVHIDTSFGPHARRTRDAHTHSSRHARHHARREIHPSHGTSATSATSRVGSHSLV